MEAVPRLPMISFPLKVSPEPTAFGPKLKQYIQDFYNEDAESYSNEIHQLENLRSMAVRPQIAVTGCSLLQKYYCQLHFLQSRFPMGADEAAAVTFTWKDMYANMVCSSADIRFEILSILYNIGAVHTQLGAKTERTSAEGMKMACSHFQWAAWAFEQLRMNANMPGSDLVPELMTYMHQLSLAQAQECILEKSMLDNRKPTIVAKVAKQIVDYYSQALSTLEPNSSEDSAVSDTVGSKRYKNWKRYVKFKRAYHLAVTQLYQGLAAEEQQKMGERVALYNASLAALNDARSIYASAKGSMGITGITGEKEAIDEALTFTNDVIEGKRKAAKNENEFIYHEEVPEKDVLPTVNGASLVKGIPFSVNDPEVSGPDIFARLVPMKVHEASSLYSEEKAKILRSIGAKIDERNQHLEAYLASLKLQHLSLWDPDSQTNDSDYLPLPEELAERCAALNARPTAIQDLVDIMGKLSDTYRDVEAMLKEIDNLLTEEEQREKRYQDAMGKRPPTIVATDLTREAKKYEEAHAKASESNQALHRAMTLHVNNLQVLAQPLTDLMANIPSPSANSSAQNSENDADKINARELKRILAKVDEMQRQRNELHAKLRDSVAQDDLTRLLVTATAKSDSLEDLFAEQISKHHALVSLIKQNLSAQDNILSALTDAYARTADTRKSVEEVLKRRELTITSLITSYDAYEDLLAKSTKGLEFYRKLEVNVTKLLQRVKSTCKVQEEEREQIIARNDKPSYAGTEVMSTSTPGIERKTGSGMKLRDHLAARLKNNISTTNYQPNQYANDRSSIPVAPVQPNSHGTPKIYANDPSATNEVSGIPVNAVPPVASENPSQQFYQQTYPNDYANYYITQQQSHYNDHHYQYRDNAIIANTVGTQNFPKTVTTNTNSMYRQATGQSVVTDVTSDMSIHAGYNVTTNERITDPTITQTQYQIPGQTSYENANYGIHYPTDYRTLPNVQGYQSQTTMPVAGVGTSGVYNLPNTIVPPSVASSSANYHGQTVQPNYNQTISTNPTNDVTIDRSISSHSRQPIAHTTSSINAYRVDDVVQDSSHSQIRNPTVQQQTQQNQRIYDDSRNYANPYQIASQVQSQISQPSTSSPAQIYAPGVAVANPSNDQQSSNVAGSNASYPASDRSAGRREPTASNDDSSRSSIYPSTTGNPIGQNSTTNIIYYGNNDRVTNDPGIANDYTVHNQQNYSDQNDSRLMHTTPPAGQSTHNYPNVYANNYPTETSDRRYANPGSLPISQIGGNAGYTNPGDMIQSHTKSSNNSGYLRDYIYAVQGHNNAITQYPNYSQGYGTDYSQNVGDSRISMTDSYKGHPGYAFDQSSGIYSYSSGYQDSQNGAIEATVPSVTFALSQNGRDLEQPYCQQQDGGASTYTNASNGTATNLTTSSQYSNGSYQPVVSDNNYYNVAVGSQSQSQITADEITSVDRTNDNVQSYQRVTDVATTAPTQPDAATAKQADESQTPKSNLDLLAELDITINHAPLVPEVHPAEKTQKNSSLTDIAMPVKIEKPLDGRDNEQPIEDRHDNLQIVWDTWYTDVQPKRDPLGDPVILQKFVVDIEKYEKFVDSLTVKTLSGSTNLDNKWNEINDVEERETKRQTSYAAQGNSSANRTTNLLPYDSTRVRISSTNLPSDYVNASHVNDLTQWTPAAFIVAQAPKPESYEAFWTMIWEQGSEVIACLATDAQLNDDIYWPTSADNNLTIGNFILSLKNSTNHTSYVQRVISMMHSELKIERIVVHMQFLVWPSSGLPSSPGCLLTFATDILSEQALRHCSPKPIVVHCLFGGSLSALFLLAAAAVCNVRAGHGAVDVPRVISTLVKYRRCTIDRDSLLFGYRMVLYHAQDTLMKRGILSSTRSTFECFENMKGNKAQRAMKKTHHPSDDFLHNLGAGMQHGIARQQEHSIGQTGSQTKTEMVSQKTDKIDPLSQLDPLWSIRR